MIITEISNIVDGVLEDPRTFCEVCHSPRIWVGVQFLGIDNKGDKAYDLITVCPNKCDNTQTKILMSLGIREK